MSTQRHRMIIRRITEPELPELYAFLHPDGRVGRSDSEFPSPISIRAEALKGGR